MERRVTLALVLSIVFFFGYELLTKKPKVPPRVPETAPAESGPATRATGPAGPAGPTASAPEPASRPEPPAPGRPERSDFVLENAWLRVRFSDLGAELVEARLRNHYARPRLSSAEKADSANWLALIDRELRAKSVPKNGRAVPGALALRDAGGQLPFLESRQWDGEAITAPDGSRAIRFAITAEGGVRIVKTFALAADRPLVTVRVETAGAGAPSRLALMASGGIVQENESRVGTSAGLYAPKSASFLRSSGAGEGELVRRTAKEASDEKDGAFISAGDVEVRYSVDLANYFGAYLRATPGSRARTRQVLIHPIFRDVPGSGTMPWATAAETVFEAGSGAEGAFEAELYLGPKDDRIIGKVLPAEYADDFAAVARAELSEGTCCPFQAILPVFVTVSRGVIFLMDVFHGIFRNWGVAIIFLTLVVKIVLFPITRRSQTSMLRHSQAMARIKPKLEALKEKHKNDRQAMAKAQMELFRAEKVPIVPLGGCLPLFLQIPIFFGLFAAIRFSIDLRHASFLWCADLSMPDNIVTFAEPVSLLRGIPCCFGSLPPLTGLHLLPILMTLAWFLNQKMMPVPDDRQLAQQQKMMLFMPFLFGLMMYEYAAGLSLYWLTSSLLGIFEQRVIRKFLPVAPKPA